MKITLIISIIFLFGINKIFSCTCPPPKKLYELQQQEFEESDCKFIGEIIESDKSNGSFKIKVIESFDGDKIGKIYNGTYDNCSNPIVEGKWIIYAFQDSNYDLNIRGCGLTRSFENPQSYHGISPNLNLELLKKNPGKLKKVALDELMNEIQLLRDMY